MNIFYLDENPYKAAKYHCDKHVVKMISESAQLLSTTHRILRSKIKQIIITYDNVEKLIKYPLPSEMFYLNKNNKIIGELPFATHIDHPCSIWTRFSECNYNYVFKLFDGLCREYEKRYGKIHSYRKSLFNKLISAPDVLKDSGCFTEPSLAMPDEFKSDDPVESYRRYYQQKVFDIDVKYKNSEKPYWLELK